MTFNKSNTTIVFLLLATAFAGVVARNPGPKGVRAQTTPSSSMYSLRRRRLSSDKVKGPSKRDCKFSKFQLLRQCTSVSLRNICR
jgi:hypothetical protein